MFNYQHDKAYCQIIPFVLSSEGGYVNHPNDPGGPTKYGIALNYNKAILKSMGVGDVKNLTLEQAREIYYQKYWLPCKANELPDIRVAYIHFDAAVNCGISQAAVFLSKLSKRPANYEGNGKNAELFLELFLEYVALRLRFYARARGRETFLAGWVNRMAKLSEDATRLTQGGAAA